MRKGESLRERDIGGCTGEVRNRGMVCDFGELSGEVGEESCCGGVEICGENWRYGEPPNETKKTH